MADTISANAWVATALGDPTKVLARRDVDVRAPVAGEVRVKVSTFCVNFNDTDIVRGRWSMVDWFDTDGRRFVLALPNAPHTADPRGLSERESQVVTYVALGQTNKMIAYRLGLSRSRVSAVLRSAMRKLNVHTRVQLVIKMREFQCADL